MYSNPRQEHSYAVISWHYNMITSTRGQKKQAACPFLRGIINNQKVTKQKQWKFTSFLLHFHHHHQQQQSVGPCMLHLPSYYIFFTFQSVHMTKFQSGSTETQAPHSHPTVLIHAYNMSNYWKLFVIFISRNWIQV